MPFRTLLRGQNRAEGRVEGGRGSSWQHRLGTLAPAAAVAATVYSLDSRHVANASETSLAPPPQQPAVIDTNGKVDVVLSSGFLSFANHAGFLKAVEEMGVDVGGVMGTSAGALSGSLYAAGYSPEQIAYELSRLPPSAYLKYSEQPWEGGVINMEKAIERYRELLPATFEELPIDFAVGVYTRDGEYKVLDSGPLPEAVVASAAIPVVFENVAVPGVGRCMDGGKHDRVGLEGWRARQRERKRDEPHVTLVHLIMRSSPFSGREEVPDNADVAVVRSPKSGVSLASLGDFTGHFDAAYHRARSQLEQRLKVMHAR